MERPEAAQAAIDHIRDRLVAPVSVAIEELRPGALWKWRNDALTLAHFANATLRDDASDEIDRLAAVGGDLWRLLNEHDDALEEIADYQSARRLGASSELVGFGEEYLSGEDTSIRDLLINALSFYLSWQSNTKWVQAGEKSHAALARSYLPEIQDELWAFLRLASGVADGEMTLDRARDIGDRAEKAMGLIAQSSMPTNAQVALLAFLYHSMLRLRLGKLIVTLERIAEAG